MPDRILDHVVVDVRDGLDAAEAQWRALGFTLTPRGHHTLGSMNHLAMFGDDYLELLGFGGDAMRPGLDAFPRGMNGLVFKTADAAALHDRLAARGVPVLPVSDFSRPVTLDGVSHAAAFRTANLPPGTVTEGRLYFCQHKTPALVWRPEYLAHANGAEAIARVTFLCPDPAPVAAAFARVFGEGLFEARADGVQAMDIGTAELRLATEATLRRDYGDALPHPGGRHAYAAVLGLRTRSLSRAADALGVGAEAGRIVIPASRAGNVTLEFGT